MRIALSFPPHQSRMPGHALTSALREAADRKRTTARLKNASVSLRALRSQPASDENWLWVALTLATTLSLAAAFGAMEKLFENWTDFSSLVTRCLG
jgi:hypothetical protein